MKYAMATLLILTSAVTTAAIAQDGGAHGPPKSVIIVIPRMPLPTPTGPTGPLQKFFEPKSELASMTK